MSYACLAVLLIAAFAHHDQVDAQLLATHERVARSPQPRRTLEHEWLAGGWKQSRSLLSDTSSHVASEGASLEAGVSQAAAAHAVGLVELAAMALDNMDIFGIPESAGGDRLLGAVCGDGTCGVSETLASCPEDCNLPWPTNSAGAWGISCDGEQGQLGEARCCGGSGQCDEACGDGYVHEVIRGVPLCLPQPSSPLRALIHTPGAVTVVSIVAPPRPPPPPPPPEPTSAPGNSEPPASVAVIVVGSAAAVSALAATIVAWHSCTCGADSEDDVVSPCSSLSSITKSVALPKPAISARSMKTFWGLAKVPESDPGDLDLEEGSPPSSRPRPDSAVSSAVSSHGAKSSRCGASSGCSTSTSWLEPYLPPPPLRLRAPAVDAFEGAPWTLLSQSRPFPRWRPTFSGRPASTGHQKPTHSAAPQRPSRSLPGSPASGDDADRLRKSHSLPQESWMKQLASQLHGCAWGLCSPQTDGLGGDSAPTTWAAGGRVLGFSHHLQRHMPVPWGASLSPVTRAATAASIRQGLADAGPAGQRSANLPAIWNVVFQFPDRDL